MAKTLVRTTRTTSTARPTARPHVPHIPHVETETATATAASVVALPPAIAKLVRDIRPQFLSFVRDYGALGVQRAQLAPIFMSAYHTWMEATQGTFVGFCRLLDTSIPADRAGYRSHVAYQAADYLRRIVDRPVEPTDDETAPDKPTRPTEVVATLIASIAPLLGDLDVIWAALHEQLHWTDRQVRHLQDLVKDATPLVDISLDGQ